MGTHAGSISHRVEEGGQKLSLGTQIATRSSVPCNFRCPRCGVLVHHNLRIIHSTVGDIEHVVDIMAKVFGMEVLGDDRAPPHIHQTSCKLSPPLLHYQNFLKKGGGEKVIHTKVTNLVNYATKTGTNLVNYATRTGTNLVNYATRTGTNLVNYATRTGKNLVNYGHKDRNSRIHNL